MTETVRLRPDEARELAATALEACGTTPANAAATAEALVQAEIDGQAGHGLSRVPSYAAQAMSGKVRGDAEPAIERLSAAAVRIDGGLGFAYPAIRRALDELRLIARTQVVGMAAIHRSHHFGQAGAHVEKLAEAGLIGLMFGNTPKAMAVWGGTKPLLGTNPIAFACPLPAREPLVIDLALSKVARGKIMAAGKAGKPIPEGWALDAEGRPTNDPAAALKGSMLPIGEAKGGALALMVEIMSAALVGSSFGFEASSLFEGEGDPPNLGQTLLALDPDRLSGGAFMARMQALLGALAEEPEVRLPGSRRLASRERAKLEGLPVGQALVDEIRSLGAA